MAAINYVDESYFNAYITDILTELKAWIDTGGNIAIKKVLLSNNSLLFYKNPESAATDEPQYKIDLPVERFLDQAKSTLVPQFAWSEELYPGSANPGLDGKPVFVLAVKGISNTDGGTDTAAYSFLNMASIITLSTDADNSLSVGSDGGLYSPAVDISNLRAQVEGLTAQVKELSTLCQQLSDRVVALENQ